MEAVLAGLFGLLIGSFLNVCIYRLPRDLSVVAPRSACPACATPIAWYDNIPVLSYLFLRGRCRACGEKITWRYPAVELLTGALFFAMVALFGPSWAAVKYCVFIAIQVVLIFTDLEQRILPDEFTTGGVAAGLGFALATPMPGGLMEALLPYAWSPRLVSLAESIFGAAFLSAALWFVGALYFRLRGREGLGLGDVKMVAAIGSFLGLSGVLLTVIIGSISGSLVGIAYIRLAGKDPGTYELPFGSFLGIGALAALFYGVLTL